MDSQRNEQAPAGAHRLLHPVEGYAPKTECFSPFVEPAKPEDRETQPQQSGATHSRDRQGGQRAGSKESKPVPERHTKVGDEEQTSNKIQRGRYDPETTWTAPEMQRAARLEVAHTCLLEKAA